MMKGRSGEVLWDDTIRLGIELRKKVRAIRREFEEKERDPARRWFFDPFVPDRVSVNAGGAEVAVGERADRRARRDAALLGTAAGRALARLRPRGAGLCHHRSQQADRADPGLRPQTRPLRGSTAMPAPVVAQYLRENRVVPRRTT
jgi:ornithine decarboxylase